MRKLKEFLELVEEYFIGLMILVFIACLAFAGVYDFARILLAPCAETTQGDDR